MIPALLAPLSRQRLLASLAAALAVAAAGPAPSALAQEKPSGAPGSRDYFYAFGKRIPVHVAGDRVGVLLRDGARLEDVQRRLERLGLELVARHPPVAIFRAAKAPSPEQLLALVRRVEAAERELVAQAGLVVTPEGAEAPMLATDRFVVRLKPDRKAGAIDALAARVGARVLMEDPFDKGKFLLRLGPGSKESSLRVSNRLEEQGEVEWAHPDFVKPPLERQVIPNDRLFGDQWHLANTGQGGGTPGADVRATLAWQLGMGTAATVIAVIDSGFDANHPDFRLWANPGEAANGVDDGDANPFVDDVNGWDFTGCDVAAPPADCGDANVTGGNHGTAVAGAAAAAGNNTTGVSGSCPSCSVMLLRNGSTDFSQGLAFGYARTLGAAIVTNSWGFAIGTPCTTNLCTAIGAAATTGRGGLGAVVLFAMNNPNVNDCVGAAPDISSLADVIAVSRSTNFDRFDLSGFGNCMDVLAPTAGTGTVAAGRGTRWITTTDRVGANGYDNAAFPAACPTPAALPPPADAQDYTACFNGTSAATPITAGVVGLMIAANGALTRAQVQNALQDTADKVEDSAGAYALANGFSAPAGGQATHGYGRVNADEAVRLVAPVAAGGKAGVDVFLRDNRLDWGNMQRPSNLLLENPRGYVPHWQSVDVKVDSPADGYQAAPTAATFDAFVDETPSAVPGDVNRVWVRVRNRGPNPAAQVDVKLHWAQFGAGLPALPGDFWTALPNDSADTSRWHPLGCAVAPPAGVPATVCRISSLAYSGASAAGTLGDAARIVQFDFPAPGIDPVLDNHFCLMALVDSPQDRVSARSRASSVVDDITPNDNNVTHRNYANLSSTRSDRFERAFLLRNPYEREIQTELRASAPRGWKIVTSPLAPGTPVRLAPGEERRIDVKLALPAPGVTGELTFTQWLVEEKRPLGGLTFDVHPDRQAAPPKGDDLAAPVYLVGTFDLREGAATTVQVANAGPRPLRAWLALFDRHGSAVGCVKAMVDGNGLLEADLAKHAPRGSAGVVKVVALDRERDVAAGPIVGNQRLRPAGSGLGETGLHAVGRAALVEDWPRIAAACRAP